jgi:hypothetical protein
VAQTQHKITKATKKLVLETTSPKVFLKLRSPRISTLKILNKNTNENKILLAINIDVHASSTGLSLLTIKYFSITEALEIPSKATKANIKPIYEAKLNTQP